MTTLKKIILAAFFVLISQAYASAQSSDTLTVGDLHTMIKQLQENQSRVQKVLSDRKSDSLRISTLQDSLKKSNEMLSSMMSELKNYKEALAKQEAFAKDVTRVFELNDKQRYTLIYTNLVYTAEFYKMLNKRLNTLYAISKVDSYRNNIAKLNNPNDNSLGFSYYEKVQQLLKENITSNLHKKEKSRIEKLAGVLLENPHIKALASATPILNIGSSLVSFVVNLAAREDDIEPRDVEKFKIGLEKYTIFYVEMNRLNNSLANNLENFQVQTNTLHGRLAEFTRLNVRDSKDTKIAYSFPSEGTPPADYLNEVFRVYNKDAVINYLDKIQKKEGNYAKVISENQNLVAMNKRTEEAIYLYKEFEYLFSQYISILEGNSKATIETLKKAKENSLSDDASKIDEQIKALGEEKLEAIKSIKLAIDIEEMKGIVDKLDEYYPVPIAGK